jgi:hypothetical protein
VESGKLRDRPQLAAAIEQCKLTGATLVIAKLDWLSRNVAFLAQLMDSDRVQFVAGDDPHATRFTLHILAAVAEHEAAQISARTKVALAAAKARVCEPPARQKNPAFFEVAHRRLRHGERLRAGFQQPQPRSSRSPRTLKTAQSFAGFRRRVSHIGG